MFNIFQILKDNIPASLRDAAARISSNRIQTYYILILIYIFCVFFLVVEVIRMFKTLNFKISNEIENVFIYLLAHHVLFSGVSKNSKSEPSGNTKLDSAVEKLDPITETPDEVIVETDPTKK
jgi:hypothetical protein